MDSVQPENNMIYIHGDYKNECIQAIVHNTKLSADINKSLLRNNTRQFIPDKIKYLTSDSNIDTILNKFGIIKTHNDEDLALPGFHIMVHWNNSLYERYIKDASPNNRYFTINTVNFEPYNVIEGMTCRYDERVTIFTSIEEDLPNRIFDIGLNMRVFVYRYLCMEHLFGDSVFKNYPKPYRFDLTIRNFIFKKERMDLVTKLVQSNKENIFTKVNAYFINIVKDVINIHSESGIDMPYEITDEINFVNSLDEKYIGNEIFSNGVSPAHIGGLKFINNTLQSDITILFESNMNWLYADEPHRWNNFTEKLVDNLMLGKPFIACSKFIIDWCRKHNFEHFGDILGIDYDYIFSHYTGRNGNHYDIVNSLLQTEILKISDMGENEYKELLTKLNVAGAKNREKSFQLFEKNTIMDDIILEHNKIFK